MPHRLLVFPGLALLLLLAGGGPAVDAPADTPADARLRRAQEFHVRTQERTGVLVPLYVYPGNVSANPAYTRLIDLKRQYETVPVWVIVNPASGPGRTAAPNYTRAVDRLVGAGCVVLGYVSTGYAKRPAADVRADVDHWGALYPRVQGVFFDEMVYDDTLAGADYQAGLTRYAHAGRRWPAVANPGADTPGRYFAAAAADVIVVHEGAAWPTAERLRGDRPGGYADHSPFTRGVLVHSQGRLDPAALRMTRKYARWVYVTDGPFRPGDPAAANPWDRLSKHLDGVFEQLAGR